MTLTTRTLPDRWIALGVAAHFVSKNQTFGRFPAQELVRTLHAQIQRGHYLFAFDMSSKPAKVVGYFGWALFDAVVAEQYAATNVPPPDELALGRDVIWILTAVADERKAFFALMKATRSLYPDHRVMAVRHKPGRKRIDLDQSRARVASRALDPG